MKLSLKRILICFAAVGILIVAIAFMNPIDSAKTATQTSRKSGKSKRTNENIIRNYGSLAGAEEGLDTEVNLKFPSEKTRKEACARLKKHGITPSIYEETLLQAIHDGCIPILIDLLIAGQKQETLNRAFDLAITFTPNNAYGKNVKKNQSVRLLVKAGAYESGLTPEQLLECEDRATDSYIRNAPQFKSDNTLLNACMAGDFHAAKKLLSSGTCLTNAQLRPLGIAMMKKDVRMAKLIIKHSRLDAKLKNSCLISAAQKNIPEIVELLLKSGSNLNLDLALKQADYRKSDECIAILLKADHFKHINWEQRLTKAIGNGHSHVISEVCKHLNNKQCPFIPHIEAIANDDADKLNQLHHQKPFRANNSIWESYSFLSLAARCGSAKCLKLLLSQQDVDVRGNRYHYTLLADAAFGKGSSECVKMLLHHPEINVNNITAITEIFNTHNHDLIQQLLQHPDFDVNQKGNAERISLLALCAENFYLSTLIKLLEKEGVDPNIHHTVRNGTPSALHTAAQCGNIPAIKILIAHGADPGLPGSSPHNLLNYAKTNAATEYRNERFITCKSIIKNNGYTIGKAHNKDLGKKCIQIIQEVYK